LYVAGGGDERYVASLRRRAAPLGNHVKFLGRVSDAERTELLRGASLLWMTSVREGWGLVVTEAAAHGTPAVVFDVPGLRDSVRHEVTGLVVERNAEALARGSQIVLNDLETFAQAALADSRTYDWEKTAAAFERILLQYASH
jgi:glycosyltransferase involved in cell wall biosynthesis